MRAASLLLLALAAPAAALPTPLVRPFGRPDALVDLRTAEGVRRRQQEIAEIENQPRTPMPDLRAMMRDARKAS